MDKKNKILVLFSGGLDSLLTMKLLKEQEKKIEALIFNLPFSKFHNQSLDYLKKQKIKYKILDCTKGKKLKEYVKIIESPKHGYGSGINPCIDCKIFMLKKAVKIAKQKNIKKIATGDVLGQRPMSQTKHNIEIINKSLKKEILLSKKEKPEKSNKKNIQIMRPLIDLGFKGKKRTKQIRLAKKHKIPFPHPAGGCLLCEKALVLKIKKLVDNNLINEKTLELVKIGRHFYINNLGWFIVGRNEQENNIIEKNLKSKHLESGKGKPAVYFNKKTKNAKKTALKLQKIYSSNSKDNSKTKKLKNKFKKYKL